MYELRIVHKGADKISEGEQKEIFIERTEDVLPVVKEIADHVQEHLIVITLDTNLKVINARVTHIGSYNEGSCSTKEILRWAVLDSARGVVIVHNHPSGHLKPSKGDKNLTRKLIKACDALDMTLLDSVIVHGDDFRSMFTKKGRFK